MLAMPKWQKIGGHGSDVNLGAGAIICLVNKMGEHEGGGIGIDGFVKVDGISGDPNVGIFGKVDSVREGEGFMDNAVHGYCREKQWQVVMSGSRA